MTKPIEVFTGFYYENCKVIHYARTQINGEWVEFTNMILREGRWAKLAAMKSLIGQLSDYFYGKAGLEISIYTTEEAVPSILEGEIAQIHAGDRHSPLPIQFVLRNLVKIVTIPNYGGSMKYCQTQAELLMAKHNNKKKKAA